MDIIFEDGPISVSSWEPEGYVEGEAYLARCAECGARFMAVSTADPDDDLVRQFIGRLEHKAH